MNLIKSQKVFFIGLLLSLSLLWPLFTAPYFSHHDDVQVIRLFEMDKCFKDRQIPCRWVPDLGGLYGYPLFNYYAPLPYYFGEIIYLISKSLIFSAKFMFAVSFLGSYLFMYLLAKKFWGNLGGSVAAIFYSFAPYHALDFYIRGAMGEMWAMMFFPAIFWALTRLEERINLANLLILAAFLGGLFASHNLSAMIFAPFTIIFWLFLFLKKKRMKFLLFSLASLMLGIALSSFYLIPMLLEKNLVHVDTTTYGYFGYTEHFKGFRKLFLEREWGYGSSIREIPGAEKEKISFQIGWVHLLGWLLALISAKLIWRKNKLVTYLVLICTSLTLFAIFMIHPRSEFIWKTIQPLKYLQFPWRFMMMVIFFISFMAGSIFLILPGSRKKYLMWAGLIFAVVAFNFTYFRPEKFLNVDDQQLLSGENWDRQIKRSIFDYLPIYAKQPPAELAKERYEILTGDSRIFDFEQGSNWLKFKTETRSHTIIRLSQYFFPDWKILVDGKEVQIDYKSSGLGLMTIILGQGNHIVEARLFDTPVRSLANMLTVIGFVIAVILFTLQFKIFRRWLLYYKERIS